MEGKEEGRQFHWTSSPRQVRPGNDEINGGESGTSIFWRKDTGEKGATIPVRRRAKGIPDIAGRVRIKKGRARGNLTSQSPKQKRLKLPS